ncbi:MAG: hypothetical protein PHQ05_12390 [Sterolibacterium sp.]|nr:hypothetical protein [Sterolibacterium sp.]
MHISPFANQAPQTSPHFNSSAASSQGTLTPVNESTPPPSESRDTPEGARVTLTATQKSNGNAPELAQVYAEIWKNGIKVAEIDIHGGVNSISGLVASAQGTVGGGGVLLAARRAAEIVRYIGGEIRVGDQIVDSRTLDMRAKLKIAYGA